MTDDRLMRPTEVARMLDVHPDTVKEWLRTGEMPGIKLPGGWRVRQSALDAWLRARETDNVFYSRGPTPEELERLEQQQKLEQPEEEQQKPAKRPTKRPAKKPEPTED